MATTRGMVRVLDMREEDRHGFAFPVPVVVVFIRWLGRQPKARRREPIREAPRVGMIFSESRHVPLQGEQARGRQHAGLAHSPAQLLAHAVRAGNEVVGSNQK